MDLNHLREQIDAVDREIIERLNRRVNLAGEIGKIKHATGGEVYVPAREEQVISKLTGVNGGPLDELAIRTIYREIFSAARALEKNLKIAYLGPEATYTHQAALKNFGSSTTYLPMANIGDVFTSVERREADYGVVPIENSTEGAVHHTLDTLAETDLKIIAQNYLEIDHCLISAGPLESVTRILSKDNALGQCRLWLGRMLPNAEWVPFSSTSAAVLEAKKHPGTAAIASRVASELYGVPIIAEKIQDRRDNITRFLIVGRQPSGPLGPGRDRSSYLFSLHDKPGALMRMLEPFSKRSLNLTKIESRPSRRKAWDYYFFVDVIGHHEDPAVKEALAELQDTCPIVKWLGSYPA